MHALGHEIWKKPEKPEKTGKNMFINLGKNRGKRDNLRKRERLESQKAKFVNFMKISQCHYFISKSKM